MRIFLLLFLTLLAFAACDTSILVDDRRVPIIKPSDAPVDIIQTKPTPLPPIPPDLFTIETVSGQTEAGFSGDGGLATQAKMSHPVGLTLDQENNLYVADRNNNRVRKVSTDGVISTIAGGGKNEGDGNALDTRLFWPIAVAIDPQNRLYILEEKGNQVRRLEADGTLTTVVNGNVKNLPNLVLDQPHSAQETRLQEPLGIDFDGDGNLYIVDTIQGRIRKVTPEGQISTIAGNGKVQFSGDGQSALGAAMSYPTDVSITPKGEIVVVDRFNHRLRLIDQKNQMKTIAGNDNIGFTGDNTPAISTSLFAPYAVDTAGDGSIFFTDTNNNLVRKIAPDGNIITIAGCPAGLCLEQITADLLLKSQNNPAKQAISVRLDLPLGIVLGNNGDVYFTEGNRVHKLTPIKASEEDLSQLQP